MANGAQPAGGGHWMTAAPPNFRDRVVQKIMKIIPQFPQGRQVNDLHGIASRYEDKVFNQSDNLEDYLRTISFKMMCVQHNKWQPVVQPASGHQQQADMGHKIWPLNTVLADSSVAGMPRTASTGPLTERPYQVQSMHIKINQAQPTTSTTPVAPVVQLHPAVVTQVQTQTQFHQQQDLMMDQRQSYHTPRGQHSNVAAMKIGHHEGQNSHQFEHPEVQNNQQSAVEVDWRDGMFQKITSLKDAHLSELMEFERVLRAFVPQGKTNEELKSLPKEQADQYRSTVNTMTKIRCVLSFLQFPKSNLPELAKHQFGKYQTTLYGLLHIYREYKARNARKNAVLQSQNLHELPRVVSTAGITDNHQGQNIPARSPLAQQENHDHHLAGEAEYIDVRREAEAPVAANVISVSDGDTAPFAGGTCNQEIHQEHRTDEAIPQLTQNVDPSGTPPAQQENRSAHSVQVEAEDDSVRAEAETPEATNVIAVNGDTAPLAGGTCNQELHQEHQADEEIPQLTQTFGPSGTPPAQQQNCSAHSVQVEAEDDSVRAEAETPVAMETLIKRGINAARSLSPVALHSLASDMGVNLKRAFRHTTSGTMDGSSCARFDDESSRTTTTSGTMDGSSCSWYDEYSGENCYKRRKTHDGSLLDEIRATSGMLVETEISIREDDTIRGVDGTVIELSYNAGSLTPDLRAVIGLSEIRTKLLVPADYPRSSPVILGGDGEGRKGVPWVVDLAFRRTLRLLPEPRSIERMAREWDSVVRRAVGQFVHRLGGGMFATRYARWESCIIPV